ncbi:MAG: DNA polymerase III subunit gamma/tau [Kordiimonadaceae bacterium]|jgi:DNA polymerase III subunit gamma/tau|nr:DNA polymerase III subunit gamma/tau [Kordiimonadaceae bacterium]MBT6036171.1 DNA polymerase III subunit gamma/tau [Kordiimonadaceae bacterium]MBT6328477.1 DNA polymerase III subunit gamma/tau [Kordiimonadaceae bacterium]MBT7583130.1 DNA polymerase III subunit gamma/tau [Kordiimonadaceae bacterium]
MPDNPDKDDHYRVLARKYRPVDFAELIGQDAMVRTLSNAIETGRLAHAFILTGVRGIGKTTTARIIAKALNCIGLDGKGTATIEPCGECENCRSISESRHVDVMEMDAASRTGIDDIREIIDGVKYASTTARFKIYIIDEVHMLSRNAFNALLKTLEEPPEHVKFIFATTEIRKVPVTVLSRCQRFDLRRISIEELMGHYSNIAIKENCEIEESALAMIARAAEGSVRDGLSLLDQAFAHGAGKVSEEQVRDMLGLADRAQIFDLYKDILAGKTADALAKLRHQFHHGADPAVIIQDMLELTHWLTRLKVVPDAGDDLVTSEAERKHGLEMAQGLSVPVLTRTWQMLLKGTGEVRISPNPISAAEMVIVRLTYSSNLPTPEDLVKQIKNNPTSTAPATGARNGAPNSSAQQPSSTMSNGPTDQDAPQAFSVIQGSGQTAVRIADPLPEADEDFIAAPVNFTELVKLFEDQGAPEIAYQLTDNVRLVSYDIGRIDITPNDRVPKNIAGRMAAELKKWTGENWFISLSTEIGEETLHQQDIAEQTALEKMVLDNDLIKSVLNSFEGAKISDIRKLVDQFLISTDDGDSNYLISADEFGLDYED